MSMQENDEESINVIKSTELKEQENSSWKIIHHIFGVELLMFFYGYVNIIQYVVIQQYVYYRVGLMYSNSENNISIYSCRSDNGNISEKSKSDKIQDESLFFILMISIAFSVTTILLSPLYILFTERFGHRNIFILIGFGIFFKSIMECFVIFFNLSLYYLIAIVAFYGASGGVNIANALCLSYVASTTNDQSRNLRIIIVILSLSCGALIASLTSGHWIKAQGFFFPYCSSLAFTGLCFFYPIAVLKDKKKKNYVESERNFKQILKLIIPLLSHNKKWICSKYTIIMMMFICYFIGDNSTVDITTSYLLSYPICMNPINLGYFITISIVVLQLGMIISGTIFNVYLNDLTIIMICLCFGVAFNFQMAFARSIISVYIAVGTNVFSPSASPYIKGFLSKQIKTENQNALFIGFNFVEMILASIAKILVILFYQQTFKHYQGLVYFIIAGFTIMALLISVYLQLIHRTNRNKSKNYTLIND